jgi:hypothetical protein
VHGGGLPGAAVVGVVVGRPDDDEGGGGPIHEKQSFCFAETRERERGGERDWRQKTTLQYIHISQPSHRDVIIF